MQVDGNPKIKEGFRIAVGGDPKIGTALEDEGIAEVLAASEAGETHCSCPNKACRLHGDCLRCVIVHRGHEDHIPSCMYGMLNERLKLVSDLTEGSLVEVIQAKENFKY